MNKSSLWDLRNVVFLLLVSLIMQALFLNPPILSDPLEYYFTATKFPHLPEQPNHWSLRIGLILPVAVLYRIFGNAEIAYYSLPLVSMTIFSIGLYFLGSRLFNRRVGFFSALWLIFIPSVLLESGILLPDIPATACITVGFAILVSFKDLHKNEISQAIKRKNNWLFFLTGFLFGWSYLFKEYFIIFILLIPVFFWVFNISYRNLIPIGAGILLMFGIEALFGLIYYDNPFVRLLSANPRETMGHIERDAARIIKFFPILLSRRGGEGAAILGVVGIINLIIQTIRKDKPHVFLLSWILLIYCFFTFLGLLPIILSWEDTVLLRLHIFRYWSPILPPLIIGGVAAVEKYLIKISQKIKLKDYIVNPLINILLVVLLSISCLRGISLIINNPKLIRNGADHYIELRNYLSENNSPDEVIWIDREKKISFDRILPIYIHDFCGRKIWDGTFKYLNTDGQFLRADEITFGKIIIDRFYLNSKYHSFPDYFTAHPENWTLVFESENQRIAIYSIE